MAHFSPLCKMHGDTNKIISKLYIINKRYKCYIKEQFIEKLHSISRNGYQIEYGYECQTM